ncbi:hypothetical protein AHiyo6_36800, partial [Arthrobacter sp. Hiyo6]
PPLVWAVTPRSAGLWPPPPSAAAGETVTAILDVPVRLLAYWDNGWTYESGDYTLRIGTSVSELPLQTTLKPVQN